MFATMAPRTALRYIRYSAGLLCLTFALLTPSPVGAAQKGDFNRDGWVDIDDLAILAEHWLSYAPPTCPGDTTGDCSVTFDDFAELAERWQTLTCSPVTAAASSQENASLSALNVVDGTLATRWSSAFADNQWLELDLGQIRTVRGVQIYWEAAYAARYNVEVSTDRTQWTRVYTNDAATGNFNDIAWAAISAQYVRINCVQRATAWGSSIYEVYVKTNDDCLAAGVWELVWSDEFEGTQLNTDNWEPMIGTGSTAPFNYGLWGWGNGEFQYYTGRTQNINVQDGFLYLVARRENYGNRQYTSGRIRSANKQDFMYGKIEARIKVPTGGGMWPAFWMMPTGNTYGEPYLSWPGHGEIDIMETSNTTDRIGGTLHYGGNYPDEYGSSGGTYRPSGVNFSQNFHVYTLEWTPTRMRWYVNGVQYYTTTSWWSTRGAYPAPFNQRFHILLNVAVGGNYTGCPMPDDSCITATFPQQMAVDYVRVYRKNE
jgi:beta-glucanase (GH16 family)